jgi:transposase-like protein
METLTEKQQTAILALLSGKTRAQTAKEAGVAESTIYEWLNDEKFRKGLKQSQNFVFDEATARLHGLLGASVETCAGILSGEKISSTSALELRAASLVFGQVSRLRELDLEDKIRELEKRFENEKR